jgi:uncharacterized protein YndB with AHSA1/START domain
MPEITCKLSINASPARVFDALTEQIHIAQWWTPDCTVEQKVGGHATFEFRGPSGQLDGYSLMRIEKLIPGQLVEWKCLEQDYQGINDWIGTTIRFRLAENAQKGTDLDFAHLGWKNTEGSFQRCTAGWGHVLGTSLKNYLEMGKGSPYLEQIARESARKAS